MIRMFSFEGIINDTELNTLKERYENTEKVEIIHGTDSVMSIAEIRPLHG